jgi:HD-like signal output (HDOD) protein
MTVEIFSTFDKNKMAAFNIERLWDHSILTGGLVKRITAMEHAGKHTIDDAFMAGLLHDIGKLILVDIYTDQYKKVLELERNEHLISAEGELQTFGAGHAEIGAYLLALWGLPDSITEAVAFHHHPRLCPADTFTPLAAVHISDALQYDGYNADQGGRQNPARMDQEYLAELHLEDKVKLWRNEYIRMISGGENP